jgi:hypothetical protein
VGDRDVPRPVHCVVGPDARPGVDLLAAVLDRAEDQPRRMEAADPLQAVLDLAAEVGVDDRHQVEHTGRDEGAGLVVVFAAAAGDHVAQRGLDARGRRVLLAPDLVHQRPRQCRPSPPSAISSSEAVGPGVPAS